MMFLSMPGADNTNLVTFVVLAIWFLLFCLVAWISNVQERRWEERRIMIERVSALEAALEAQLCPVCGEAYPWCDCNE